MANDILLGVNIDHVASIRQSRKTKYPNVIHAAFACLEGGADSITVHLREDRRHIQDRDVELLKEMLVCRLNLEMAVTDEMLQIASSIRPSDCCLVPERREELTTEGGLDVVGHFERIKDACSQLREASITVSLFIDADEKQIEYAAKSGAPVIEIHTGHFADARGSDQEAELEKIVNAVTLADNLGLQVNAGHGLHYQNVRKIAQLKLIAELNIGHSIVAEAIFTGITPAVRKMKQVMLNARM